MAVFESGNDPIGDTMGDTPIFSRKTHDYGRVRVNDWPILRGIKQKKQRQKFLNKQDFYLVKFPQKSEKIPFQKNFALKKEEVVGPQKKPWVSTTARNEVQPTKASAVVFVISERSCHGVVSNDSVFFLQNRSVSLVVGFQKKQHMVCVCLFDQTDWFKDGWKRCVKNSSAFLLLLVEKTWWFTLLQTK